ncbi:MAG: ATP-binding protein [Microbacter sp.]
MFFHDIIGQELTKQRLRAFVAEDRLPHALLLIGAEGVGILPLALAFAQYVNCTHRTADEACGKCPSCIKFAKLQHPDLHFVFPIIKLNSSKVSICDDFVFSFRKFLLENPYGTPDDWMNELSSDKQGMIYEAESAEIIRKLNFKTYESEYKIMIIWQPERMHTACANKLLKILEEPPEKTLFFLISEQPDLLLPTILSRVQRINVPLIEKEDMSNALQQRFSLNEQMIRQIVRVANGNFRKALDLIISSDSQKFNFEQFKFFMRNSYKRDVQALKKWSDMMSKIGREKQKGFFKYMQNMLRENFILNLEMEELNYLNEEEMAFSSKFSVFVNERNIEKMMEETALAEQHIESNVNAKMIFFDLSIQFSRLLKN